MKMNLLDHGYVRLVSYTQPVPQDGDQVDSIGRADSWTGDLEIVRAARVSYNADWRSTAEPGDTPIVREAMEILDRASSRTKDEKLIHSLWRRGHTSPFEAMTFTFEVQAPIFVFRQWHRHRTQSYNEVSARYTELPDLFYVPKPEHIGEQSKTEKQARHIPDDLAPKHFAEVVEPSMLKAMEDAFTEYRVLLRNGVPRELARLVLPLSTYSRMYATANLLNWFRFITLRSDPHAQYEIRVYSDAILSMLETVCPVAVSAFRDRQDESFDIGETNAVIRAVEDEIEMMEDFARDGHQDEVDAAYLAALKKAHRKLPSR